VFTIIPSVFISFFKYILLYIFIFIETVKKEIIVAQKNIKIYFLLKIIFKYLFIFLFLFIFNNITKNIIKAILFLKYSPIKIPNKYPKVILNIILFI